MWQELTALGADTLSLTVGIALILGVYIAISTLCFAIYHQVQKLRLGRSDFNSLKTVTFGDESAVSANRVASIGAVVALFVIWGVFTGSNWVPFHVSAPFGGETRFSYSAQNAAGERASATVQVLVGEVDKAVLTPLAEVTGFARNDTFEVRSGRTKLLKVQKNDVGGRESGYRVTEIDGQPISGGDVLQVANGQVRMTAKGSLSFSPDKGLQMEAIWLPSPEAVVDKIISISREGYQNVSLGENLGWSLMRVVLGFLLGCLFGIPLGFAMGLNGWMRGWFDPIVEFMRPVPPLALIPLVIIWFGIWEQGKISLLFLASLWIMTIAARSGVSGVSISKVHAAYSLGASKYQVLMKVILPNSLPEIFTGARVAMGVCWGTVVAAELVAAEKGAGKMIIAASKFQQTDIVIMGIILIGIIGYAIEMLMRKAELKLIPWKGKD
ncbi:MAG: ABC transporter permease [Pseudomonadales bacterium]